MKNLLFLLLILLSYGAVAQLDSLQQKEFDNEKFALVQNLLTCHTLAKEMAKKASVTQKGIIMNVGSSSYNKSYQAFMSMQVLNPDMDKKLRTHVTTALEVYSKAFSSVYAMDSVEMVLALSFVGYRLRKIVDILY